MRGYSRQRGKETQKIVIKKNRERRKSPSNEEFTGTNLPVKQRRVAIKLTSKIKRESFISSLFRLRATLPGFYSLNQTILANFNSDPRLTLRKVFLKDYK